MLRSIFLVSTTVFWLGMMSQLIGREFFQLTPIQAAYQILPVTASGYREEYRGIYLGDNLIGFTRINLETLEDEPAAETEESAGASADEPEEPAGEPASEDSETDSDEPADPLVKTSEFMKNMLEVTESAFELRQSTYMTFLFLGEEREMMVRSKALLDERLELQVFELKLSSGKHWTTITGQVARNNLNIVIDGAGEEPIRRIFPIEKPLFFSEALPVLWTPENLRPGKSGRLQLWNPLLMAVEQVEFRVGEKTILAFEGKDTEVYPITLKEQGIETHYWCTPEGVVLKNESPTGLLMHKKEAWQIFDTLREKRSELTDLPNLYSIPATRIFKKPEQLKTLKIVLETPEGRQAYEIHKEDLTRGEAIEWPVAVSEELKPFTQPEHFIQSDDLTLREVAREAAGKERSAVKAAVKLMNWVHNWITPTPTVSIPSALQVFQNRQGDCNEHTVLFTALARSLGIPTRMVAGIVYQNERFFYHAWPEIYTDRWIGMDPTFLQAPVDVTHIPLVTGNLEDQISLIQKLGQIKVVSLEAFE